MKLPQTIPEAIADMKKMLEVHIESTSPMNPYFTGMANGIIFAITILDGKEPQYLSCNHPSPFRQETCKRIREKGGKIFNFLVKLLWLSIAGLTIGIIGQSFIDGNYKNALLFVPAFLVSAMWVFRQEK